jgi:LemA protein
MTNGGSMRRLRLIAPLLALALTGCGYNRIQTLDEQINAFEGQIKVQLQRRADLVPNLVETVRGYAQQEQTIFIGVAEARSRLNTAIQSGDLSQMATANQGLTGALSRLIAVSESYPQLKSNENFRALQDQLEGTENRIATARQDYNSAVQTYNSYIRQFPVMLTAKVIGKHPRTYFELATAGAAEVPHVNFTPPAAAAPGASKR